MRSLLIAILMLVAFDAEAGRGGRGRGGCARSVDTVRIIQQKLNSLHRLKGTFETLFPIEPNSVAWRFPELYERLLRLFEDRPSHLIGLNRGNPPEIGTPMTEIFQRMTGFAHNIGKDIDFFATHSIANQKDPAFRLIQHYADRFKMARTRLSRTAPGNFDSGNIRQLGDISSFGKKAICSLWAEMRLSMRIGRLSLVDVYVRTLVEKGVIRNQPELEPYYNQEIDHFWFPYNNPELVEIDQDLVSEDLWSTQLDYHPDAVAIGDSKVFDSIFDEHHQYREEMHDQLKRLLTIASYIGANYGTPPQVYYFFVAGITKKEIAVLQRITRDFNHQLKMNHVPSNIQAPVELFVYGDYDLLKNP